MQYLDLASVIPIVKDGGRSITPFASAVFQYNGSKLDKSLEDC